MTKTEAIRIFGSKKAFAEAMGVHRSLVSKLPEELPTKYGDRALGAAIRLGRMAPRLIAGRCSLVAGDRNEAYARIES